MKSGNPPRTRKNNISGAAGAINQGRGKKQELKMKMQIVKEIFEFLLERKKYWLIPIIIILLLIGILIVLTQGSVVAPFIYTLF
jgi:hypothetical protein